MVGSLRASSLLSSHFQGSSHCSSTGNVGFQVSSVGLLEIKRLLCCTVGRGFSLAETLLHCSEHIHLNFHGTHYRDVSVCMNVFFSGNLTHFFFLFETVWGGKSSQVLPALTLIGLLKNTHMFTLVQGGLRTTQHLLHPVGGMALPPTEAGFEGLLDFPNLLTYPSPSHT